MKNKIPDRKAIKDRLLEFGITHKNKDFGVEEKKKTGRKAKPKVELKDPMSEEEYQEKVLYLY